MLDIAKIQKNQRFFKDFAMSPWYHVHQETIKLYLNGELKRSRMDVFIHDRKNDQFWIHFGWIFDGFWKDFG